MSIIFSRRCEYAIQTILYLARKPEGTAISIRDFADRLHIPYHYLAKILQDLTRKKILRSRRGPSGGYALAQSADAITLMKIVDAVDGPVLMDSCVMGFPECSSSKPCSLHEQWALSREGIKQLLGREKIASLARKMQKQEYLR